MDRIDALKAFVRLVELGSFSAVGTELRVKQSTVSKWLAALEDELGAQLLERTTRSQRVTGAGHLFYERARDILAAYDDATAALQRGKDPEGRIRVSVPVVFGRLHLVPHMARFLKRYADMEVELLFADRYVNLVEEGVDVAIRVGTPVDSSLRARTLAETARRLVASPGYVKQRGAPSTARELEQHQCLIHTGLRAGDTWDLARGGKIVRVSVRGRFSANNSEALLAMAKSGLGVALLAAWLVDGDLAAGRLVELLPDHAAPRAPIQALFPPGRHVHPRVQAFVDFMAEALGSSLGKSGRGVTGPT
ncbi:LysR family transcriptional regulator [Sorangium sp. So ce260]|uniref:LysR family transcriptional regulator n=1 Tax=Sorangium sp. So ce260 TaxID=3133291 RepID=UPI003F5E4B40